MSRNGIEHCTATYNVCYRVHGWLEDRRCDRKFMLFINPETSFIIANVCVACERVNYTLKLLKEYYYASFVFILGRGLG